MLTLKKAFLWFLCIACVKPYSAARIHDVPSRSRKWKVQSTQLLLMSIFSSEIFLNDRKKISCELVKAGSSNENKFLLSPSDIIRTYIFPNCQSLYSHWKNNGCITNAMWSFETNAFPERYSRALFPAVNQGTSAFTLFCFSSRSPNISVRMFRKSPLSLVNRFILRGFQSLILFSKTVLMLLHFVIQ